jgi:hypothetical protein
MIQDGTQDFYNQQAELARQHRLQRPPTTMSATEKIATSAQPQSDGDGIHQEDGPPGAGGVSGPLMGRPTYSTSAGVRAEPPGIQALMCVISSLRDIAHFSDEEGGELMSALCALRDWAYAQTVAAPQPAPHLPERDASLPAERQGLFRKFVVGRVDGSDKPGGKHHGCTYFVLDVDHDPCARPALAAYAAACESTHPTLAADLRTKWGVVPAPQPAPAPLSDQSTKPTFLKGEIGE